MVADDLLHHYREPMEDHDLRILNFVVVAMPSL